MTLGVSWEPTATGTGLPRSPPKHNCHQVPLRPTPQQDTSLFPGPNKNWWLAQDSTLKKPSGVLVNLDPLA